MTAMATAIGPVGPDIRDRVPPNTDAKKPTAMAPYSPGRRPQARRHAKGQRHRQCHHRCSEAAKNIPTECMEIVVHSIASLRLKRNSIFLTGHAAIRLKGLTLIPNRVRKRRSLMKFQYPTSVERVQMELLRAFSTTPW